MTAERSAFPGYKVAIIYDSLLAACYAYYCSERRPSATGKNAPGKGLIPLFYHIVREDKLVYAPCRIS